jgi:hypothetical protein
MKRKHSKVGAVLILALLVTACPFGSKAFAQDLRIVLAASPPLIESLPLPASLKAGLITDFTDMAGHTATLSDCISGAENRPAKLVCVQTLEGQVETVINRGNFGRADNERLQQILGLIRGIIASAIIYYGGTPSTSVRGVSGSSEKVTAESIKAQIKELREAMKP